MELSELSAYAGEKYQIREQRKWSDFPGFSVLCHPRTGKWLALLMRQWDSESGEEIQRCDLKCGRDELARLQRPYLSLPIRMRGGKWTGVIFDDRTEAEIVFRLFDRAVALEERQGAAIVLASSLLPSEGGYRDTPLPAPGKAFPPAREKIPDRLRKMRQLTFYVGGSAESRAGNFYRQAVYMQDYEDDSPWEGEFVHYFPTYQDLNIRQLRGYFTWRARVRRGDFQPIAASAAYIYIYELLNGVGADSPEEGLRKMQEFERGYLDSGIGDGRMRENLRRWMLEYAVLRGLPPEMAARAADPELTGGDAALQALRQPEEHSDDEVFLALCRLGGKKTEDSPVLTRDPVRGKRLFAGVWRKASSYCLRGKDLFTLCFGKPRVRDWHPLSNAVIYAKEPQRDAEYRLNACRTFRCRDGRWQVEAFEKLSFDRDRLQGFLHAADAGLRRYLKTGRYLREKPEEAWVIPYVEAAIEEDKKILQEAARPKITLDLSSLEKIRSDAAITRDSLLTEDAWEACEESAEETVPAVAGETADIPLDAVQIRILGALMAGQDVSGILRENHLMPSLVADAVNEALMDEIGDTVLICEGDALLLVEDYTEELEGILGGNRNG